MRISFPDLLKRKTWYKFAPLLKVSLSTLFWLPSALFVTEYLYTVKIVTGSSMQPTLNPIWSPWRDIVIFDRRSIRVQCRCTRGDVVALWSPVNPKCLLVKRILAMEGDIVKTLPPYPDKEVRVPKGHIWVEGDETYRTDDSNRFGPVPLALLHSKLVFILWPFTRYGSLRRPSIPTARIDVPRGPAWRQDMAAVEREMWRKSRVTIT